MEVTRFEFTRTKNIGTPPKYLKVSQIMNLSKINILYNFQFSNHFRMSYRTLKIFNFFCGFHVIKIEIFFYITDVNIV